MVSKTRKRLICGPVVAALSFLVCCATPLLDTAKDTATPISAPPPVVESTPTPIPTETILPPPATDEVADPIMPEKNNPYAELVLTEQEKQLLACMAYSEANNQEFDGQVAVILVALNRYLSDEKDFQGSLTDILLAKDQFCVGNTYTETQLEAVESALAGNEILDLNTDVVFFSTGGLKYGSYFKTIGGHVFRTYH